MRECLAMEELLLEGAGAAASALEAPSRKGWLCKRLKVGASLPGGTGRVSAGGQSHSSAFKVNIQNTLMALLAGISQQCAPKSCKGVIYTEPSLFSV